jgi:hypothetical protein
VVRANLVRERPAWARAGLAALILLAGCSSSPTTTEQQALVVEALSTRAEYVTGGDVLVAVSSPANDSLEGIVVRAGDRDVSDAFTVDRGRLVGLVEGLPNGPTRIEAVRGDERGSMEVVNHATSGPLFSGSPLEPYVCKTEQFGLGPPTDTDCSAPTTSGTEAVGDVATTVERGVINRSIYTIAMPQSGWNGRLVYRFGGGCGTTYSQGVSFINAADPSLVGKGYAVASSTLNTYQSLCNEVLSAETALMVKEHFIEEFGLPAFTIGEGGSGGAIQQLQIAQNYPGILDAIAPTVPFADAISTAPSVTDCGLLLHYFQTPTGSALRPEQQQAVAGHRQLDTCRLWARTFLQNIDPTVGCDSGIPREQIYDPSTNRDGVRCTLQDVGRNVIGVDPSTGFAARPLDNEGVVYGLEAYEDGILSFEQLLDLNARIGGYDIDGRVTPTRHTAPDELFERTFATGRVTEGGGLVDVPIVLTNIYTDALGDIHDRQRAFSIRERLRTADGADAGNLLIWTFPSAGNLTQTLTGAVGDTSTSIVLLDQWLSATAADGGAGTTAEKLARNRPDDAVDRCVLPSGEELSGASVYDGTNECTEAYPVAKDARRAAGAPLRDDVLKCQTQPVGDAEFTRSLTAAQREALQAIFPEGVCDWTRPGVGQVPLSGIWISFATS